MFTCVFICFALELPCEMFTYGGWLIRLWPEVAGDELENSRSLCSHLFLCYFWIKCPTSSLSKGHLPLVFPVSPCRAPWGSTDQHCLFSQTMLTYSFQSQRTVIWQKLFTVRLSIKALKVALHVCHKSCKTHLFLHEAMNLSILPASWIYMIMVGIFGRFMGYSQLKPAADDDLKFEICVYDFYNICTMHKGCFVGQQTHSEAENYVIVTDRNEVTTDLKKWKRNLSTFIKFKCWHLFPILPGALTECYDELGNRYQLPVYCLSPPVNMIEERSEELDGSDPDSGALEPSTGSTSDPTSGGECQLRLRLSTGRDLRLAVRSTDTVGMMKRRLQSHEGVPASTQRWFFSGRPLTDRLRLDQLNISRDYVVQVILSQPPPPEPVSTPGHTPEASGPVTVEGVAALSEEPTPVEN